MIHYNEDAKYLLDENTTISSTITTCCNVFRTMYYYGTCTCVDVVACIGCLFVSWLIIIAIVQLGATTWIAFGK